MKWARVARTNSIVPVYLFEHEKIAAWCSSCFMCKHLLSPPRPQHVCGHEQSFPVSVVAPRNHTQANHQNSPVDIHSVGYLARGLHPHHKVSSTDKSLMSLSSDGPLMDNKSCKKDDITAKTCPIVERRHKYPSRHRRPWRPEEMHTNTTRLWEHSERNNLAQREPSIVCFATSRPMFPATSTNNPVPVGRCFSQHARKAPIRRSNFRTMRKSSRPVPRQLILDRRCTAVVKRASRRSQVRRVHSNGPPASPCSARTQSNARETVPLQ